ncbi:MAG: arylamine N-acetyltransferase family protein [Aureispira sp.]
MLVDKYLERIKLIKPSNADKDYLFQLQKFHLLNIPFENLDIHYGQTISLDLNDIYKKIIEDKRGGFCYELNGLFNQLLNKLGFNSYLISAEVHIKNGDYSPIYDHLAIIVKIENEEFLVDVGFGKFTLEPLLIQLNQDIIDTYGRFRFERHHSDYLRVSEVKNEVLIPQYIFTKEERKLSEFKNRCHFHQTSKDSHFAQQKVISMAKSNGRITLNNTQLKITKLGKEKTIKFKEEKFEAHLLEHFNIDL